MSNKLFFSNCKSFRRLISNDCKIGFIGLGNMGAFMALNLSKKGHKVVTYDKDSNRIKHLKSQEGGDSIEVVDSVNELAKSVNMKAVITMLPSSPQVIEVYQHSGLLENVPKKTIMIDCTTGDPSVSQSIEKEARKYEVVYLDAPVSGGVNAARDGLLTFMVGGDKSDTDKAKVLLSKMGKNIFHCGEVGTGLAAKICNNMLLGISMIAVSEAMNLGKRLGLEPQVLAKIINSSSGRCWSSDTYNPVPGVMAGVPSSNNYDGGFGVALMTKDLGLSQVASINKGVNIPLGSAAHQIYRLLCEKGYSQKDFSVIYQFLNDTKK